MRRSAERGPSVGRQMKLVTMAMGQGRGGMGEKMGRKARVSANVDAEDKAERAAVAR